MKDLLPIGSVVLLTGGEKRLMIFGLMQQNSDDGNDYDYLGCLYPEGFVGFEHTYMFNHEDIEKTDFVGYTDKEHENFRNELQKLFGDTETPSIDAES